MGILGDLARNVDIRTPSRAPNQDQDHWELFVIPLPLAILFSRGQKATEGLGQNDPQNSKS